MSCSVSIYKFLLIIVNLLVAFCGLAMMVDGLFLGDKRLILVPEIAIGAVLFVASFLGCVGVFKECVWMLLTFAVILLSVFMLSVIFGLIVIFVLSLSELEEYIKCTIDVMKLFNDYLNNIDTEGLVRKQLELTCCGADGPIDFASTFNSTLPTTCCENGGRPNCRLGDDDVIQMGCLEACEIGIWSTKLLGIIIIAFAVIELAGAICSLCLIRSIKNQSDRTY